MVPVQSVSQQGFTDTVALSVCWGFPDAEALRVSRIGAAEAEALRVSRIGFPDPDADADAVASKEGQIAMSEVQFIREGSQHEEGAEGEGQILLVVVHC